jgi:hypothetical protein
MRTCGKGGQQVVCSDSARDTNRQENKSEILRDVGLPIDKPFPVRIPHQFGEQITWFRPVSNSLVMWKRQGNLEQLPRWCRE